MRETLEYSVCRSFLLLDLIRSPRFGGSECNWQVCVVPVQFWSGEVFCELRDLEILETLE